MAETEEKARFIVLISLIWNVFYCQINTTLGKIHPLDILLTQCWTNINGGPLH